MTCSRYFFIVLKALRGFPRNRALSHFANRVGRGARRPRPEGGALRGQDVALLLLLPMLLMLLMMTMFMIVMSMMRRA